MNFKILSRYRPNGLQTVLFLLALFILGSTWVSVGNILRVIQCEQQVVEAHQIIGQIQKVGALTVDIETGYRGFTLSGQPKYLEPMNKALAVLPREMERLNTMTASDSFLQQKIKVVAGLILEKAQLGAAIVVDREKAKIITAKLLTAANQGKTLMDRIRGLLDEMTAAEEARLQRRRAEAQTGEQETILFYVMTVVLSLLFLGLGFYLLDKNRKNRLELVKYNKKLEESNQDLRNFVFVASHDLKEPLRKIDSFGTLLKTELGGTLTSDAADYVFKMQDAARRMNVLIDSLVQLSRVTTQAKPFESVDLSVILQEVQSDLEIRLKECGGRVEIGSLPRLEADAAQMRQLFQNLIGNALKYRQDDRVPVVRVEGEADLKTGQARLWVRDNGMGFDQRDAEKIFNIFQRLDAGKKREARGSAWLFAEKSWSAIMGPSPPNPSGE